jgi:WD40 repeat protein
VNALVFTEIPILDGSVHQVIWLDDESDLALATSNGLYLYQLSGNGPQILDAGAPVISVAYIPDDGWVIGGGLDALIRIWDESTGKFITYLSGHLLGVIRLSYAQAANFLASASDDATVRIWDSNGNLMYTLRGPITRVVDMAFSSNGRLVAAASHQHTHIWDSGTGELSHIISQPMGWYTAAAFSPDSRVLATAYDGRRLELWDTVTWERIEIIPLSAAVRSLAYSPDGRMLAVGYESGRIQIWDAYYDFLLADFAGHPKLTSMTFNPYDDQLATSSAEGTIRVWDIAPLLNP